MPIKNVFMLAGAVLLIAGCSSDVTAPTSARSGGAAASTKAAPNRPTTTTESGTVTSTSEEPCRYIYVNSGRTDSVCAVEEQ